MQIPLPMVQAILMQSPLHLIWVAGIAMAWMHREEHPRVSWLVGMALSILLLDALLGTYARHWLPPLLAQYEPSSSRELLTNLLLGGSIHLITQVVAWGMLLFSMFNWRSSY